MLKMCIYSIYSIMYLIIVESSTNEFSEEAGTAHGLVLVK